MIGTGSCSPHYRERGRCAVRRLSIGNRIKYFGHLWKLNLQTEKGVDGPTLPQRLRPRLQATKWLNS